MKSLCEKYRPATLSDLRGHNLIQRQLASFCRKPTSKAFIFAGVPGAGKTSAAYCIARELGCDMEQRPLACGGCFEIASGELTAETVREMFRTTLAYRPFFGSGWKVLICNEADAMSKQSEIIFLDILEHLPEKTVVIFTTNEAANMSARFKQRCELHTFKTPVKDFGQGNGDCEIAAQAMIDEVWQKELGHNHSPRLGDLDGWRDGGNLSFRSVLQALEPLIRLQREDDELAAQKPVAEIIPALPVNDRIAAIRAERERAANFFATA